LQGTLPAAKLAFELDEISSVLWTFFQAFATASAAHLNAVITQ
jgi:hypothetical protein